MAYAIQFNKQDTLAATLNSGATSTTITTGSFGSPSGTQVYVVDWDVPSKAEIISATVAGSSVTSVTRGLSGGAAGTTNHAIGAKIASIFTPQHYANGLGAIASNDPWTAWTPTVYKNDHVATLSPTGVLARYVQVGKTVHAKLFIDSTGNPTATGVTSIWFTPPVAYRTHTSAQYFGTGRAFTTAVTVMFAYADPTVPLLVGLVLNAGANFNTDNSIEITFTYEAA